MLLAISSMSTTIISSIVLFLGVSLLLVVILLIAKKYLVPSGKAVITINDDKKVEVAVRADSAAARFWKGAVRFCPPSRCTSRASNR